VFLLGHNEDATENYGWAALACYCIYLCHLVACDSLNRAFGNETQGLDAVARLMDRPRHENPRYRWSVQCYHYEDVTYYERETDSNGNERQVAKTRSERRNTHSARMSGEIPSIDQTPAFIPAVHAQQTQIDTAVALDFSQSNYNNRFLTWCARNHWDVHQDRTRTEDLPSRVSSCLAVLVKGSRPWWLRQEYYWLANVLLLSVCFRWRAQAALGYQQYTYRKRCFNI